VVKKPTKSEIRARDTAVAEAGGPAPPQPHGHGFDALVGQDSVIEALRRALGDNRLPHALLFHGPAGVGKATCAGILAQALNCEVGGFKDACGTCVSCRKISRGLHPDIIWMTPAGKGGQIKVERIRKEIIEKVGFRPYEGRRRIVMIDDAHRLNPSSQNSLLKTLEEPPPSSLMVLATTAPESLLPTVRSRCQPLRFRPLAPDLLQRHLEEVHDMPSAEARLRAALVLGSVGRALDLDLEAHLGRRTVAEESLRDAIQGGAALLAAAEVLLAAGAGDRKVDQAASAMTSVRDILRDLLVLSSGGDPTLLVNADRRSDWQGWASEMGSDGILDALDAVQRADDRLHGPVQPNVRLVIEQALIEAGAALKGEAVSE
jgi:DNA polymerase-3 subunit delta'